jgi:hypothetical protein
MKAYQLKTSKPILRETIRTKNGYVLTLWEHVKYDPDYGHRFKIQSLSPDGHVTIATESNNKDDIYKELAFLGE